MAEQHQSVDQVRSDESGTTGDWGQLRPGRHEPVNAPRIRFRSLLGRSLTGGKFARVVNWMVLASASTMDCLP